MNRALIALLIFSILCLGGVFTVFLLNEGRDRPGRNRHGDSGSAPVWEDISGGGGSSSGSDRAHGSGLSEDPAGEKDDAGRKQKKVSDEKMTGEGYSTDQDKQESADPEWDGEQAALSVRGLTASRVSGKEIQLEWPDDNDAGTSRYIVMRMDMKDSGAGWQKTGEVASDGSAGGEAVSYRDVLVSAEPQQYKYRIDPEPSDDSRYRAEQGDEVLRSNVLICLDPGHYKGKNAVPTADSYGYEENIVTLRIGLALRDILDKDYGVSSIMTRETEHISIGGYSDKNLDSGHISLRGKAAAGCDLFVSLHTNSNRDNVNGYPTFNQHIAINKPIVLLSIPACSNSLAVDTANAIGSNLSRINEKGGLCTTSGFGMASVGNVMEWTEDYNDSYNLTGSVCVRHGENGEYYGVLRGASEVGVPGLIVEHGFHTTVEIRREAMEGTLVEQWASADAAGISRGFGFLSLSQG